ncbi:hypothetical protein IWQ60_007683 [Tieghemiomyces parasiticus]|uniref:NADH:ubiquinone oxidoreductase intermediate-associated protein 30 domain-containing protein n=1 Tax=Tieghemiomyces parasiticus TaxID=78921 RepID=A0A9W7ZW16_9FUNG|nr:hypothetical protein IWQ60_007683 [Tieghemiomyces parasiticus]
MGPTALKACAITVNLLFYIFGGDKLWDASKFTAVDDRVRGGSSESFLVPVDGGRSVTFQGTLDTKTLGGAGFASQRTEVIDDQGKPLNLTGAASLRLTVKVPDAIDQPPLAAGNAGPGSDQGVEPEGGKYYAINLHDDPAAAQPEGRRNSSVEFKYVFQVPSHSEDIKGNGYSGATRSHRPVSSAGALLVIDAPLHDFKPYYRGRPLGQPTPNDPSGADAISEITQMPPGSDNSAQVTFKDTTSAADPPQLRLDQIYTVDFMMASYFDRQSGPFALQIVSVAAVATPDDRRPPVHSMCAIF